MHEGTLWHLVTDAGEIQGDGVINTSNESEFDVSDNTGEGGPTIDECGDGIPDS
jgi:hypothetical protein